MAAFFNRQHHSFLLNQAVCFPNPTTTTAATTATSFQHFHQPLDQVTVANNLQSPDSSMSAVLDDQKVESANEFLAKKRKEEHTPSLYHPQPKDKSTRLKKHKRSNDDHQEEKRKKNIDKGSTGEDADIGYIHVRVRRGQATDSHSLAERVRREKISERMKLLQAIVPGCDKVTGKALMLDEIINYVQSLQNQVEFLSMKLASANPVLYDFGMDLDTFMLKPDENIMPVVEQCSPTVGAATFTLASENYHLPPTMDASATDNLLLFQQSQMPNILSQGNGQHLWDRFVLSNNQTSLY